MSETVDPQLKQWQQTFFDLLYSTPKAHSQPIKEMSDEMFMMRFKVYKNNLYQGLIRALERTYPVCQAIVGEPCFSALAYHYALENPMQSPNLNEYGEHFGEFIAKKSHDSKPLQEIPYLAELASLEWLVQQSYYATSPAPFDPAPIATLNSEAQQQLIFCLNPSLYFFTSSYPLYAIWQKHQTQQDEVTIEHPADRYFFCCFQSSYRVQVARLEAPIYALLQNIKKGLTLGELIEENSPVEQLGMLIEKQWISGIHIPEPC